MGVLDCHATLELGKMAGRSELIAWVNKALSITIEKIEQCCSGAIYVQLMDLVHTGRVPLAKVRFNAALEHEYIQNYKVLQTVFTKLGLEKHIGVDRLIKGRYQDNHEFLQWLRQYVDSNCNVNTVEYDGTRRRVVAVIQQYIAKNGNEHLTLGSVTNALPKWAHDGVTVRLIKDCLAQIKAAATSKATGENSHEPNGKSCAPACNGNEAKLRKVSGAPSHKSKSSAAYTRASTADTHIESGKAGCHENRSESMETADTLKEQGMLQAEKERNAELERLLSTQKEETEAMKKEIEKRSKQMEALQEELERQKGLVESMKKKLGQSQADRQVSKMSKDFYYNKLRKIEIMCQKNESGSIEVKPLLEILYATDNVV